MTVRRFCAAIALIDGDASVMSPLNAAGMAIEQEAAGKVPRSQASLFLTYVLYEYNITAQVRRPWSHPVCSVGDPKG